MIKYVDIKKIVENDKYPFTYGQMRAFITKRNQNGLYKAIRKIGKRIYIREDMFDEWIESFACATKCYKDVVVGKPIFEKKSPIKLNDMNFLIRTENALKRNNINTIKDLINNSESDLLKLNHLGKRVLRDIKEQLSEFGLSLKKD